MRLAILDILRCPYCGGRLELIRSLPHTREGDVVLDGVLGCHCCLFPVVGGIPVLHLQPNAVAARAAVEAGDVGRAFRVLISSDEARSDRFAQVAARQSTTFLELTETLGEELEGGYFLYRFSDPSFLTASAVVRAVAGPVLSSGGRAIDVCGGAGHLTRVLLTLSSPPPVIADLYFVKLWLAARYIAPGCEPVCCDGNAPLPFARGTFGFALCADAFMYVWTKRQLVGEMERLVDRGGGHPSAVAITHAHSQDVWSPSHGDPLPPDGYRELFEALYPRAFVEERLLDDVIGGGPLDLSQCHNASQLSAAEALTIVATRDAGVFRPYELESTESVHGQLRLNPLYKTQRSKEGVRMKLVFPSPDYEDEYGACRRYLPEEVTIDVGVMDAVAEGRRTPEVQSLLSRRIVLELPKRYC